jgi:MoaA/NifB/PqqE/SkfB family radical SAM enzyme
MGFTATYLRNLGAVALRRQPKRPLLFSYYVTHRCNLNCSYCCDGDGKRFSENPIPELTTEEALRLVSILAASADTLDITGGEPLLRDDLEAILAGAKAARMRTVLNTKGIGLPERRELLAATDVLVISLDTLDPGRLAELLGRPPEVARRVLEALDFALTHRGRTALVLSAVATPTNIVDVAEVMRFAERNRIGFHLSPEIVGTRVNPALRTSPAYRECIDRALAAKALTPSVLGVRAYLRGIRDFSPFRCRPLLMPVIRPDGRLYYPCLESKQAAFSILAEGSYSRALARARAAAGEIPNCTSCCHIFCHMALSLLQGHPLQALGEARVWRGIATAPARPPENEGGIDG